MEKQVNFNWETFRTTQFPATHTKYALALPSFPLPNPVFAQTRDEVQHSARRPFVAPTAWPITSLEVWTYGW
jgi:hypothetical protein